MSALNDLIESREVEIRCPHCGWRELRTLRWLAPLRDMNCTACRNVIVLNTSERKREIACLRRQISTLHDQLAGMMPASRFAQRVQTGMRAAPVKLKLEISMPALQRAGMGQADGEAFFIRRGRR